MFAAQSYVVGMKVNEANFGWQGLATINSNADHKEMKKNLKKHSYLRPVPQWSTED